MSGWSYMDFCSPQEVEVFKRVKGRSMNLGKAARQVAAGLTGGVIGDGDRSAKQFVRTRNGLYRLCNGEMSDNTSETLVHNLMGVKASVKMGEWDSMGPWLREHGVEITYLRWFELVRAELWGME